MEIKDLQQLSDVLDDRGFFDSPIQVKAKQDFLYLCNKTGYSAMGKRHYMAVSRADSKGKHLGEFLVVGYNTADKTATFPKELIDTDAEDVFVAVVCYANGKVADVLVFAAASFRKIGMLGIFKNLKSANRYGIVLGDGNTLPLKKYSFGFVLNNL